MWSTIWQYVRWGFRGFPICVRCEDRAALNELVCPRCDAEVAALRARRAGKAGTKK
jgi:hypothetical protein